MRKFSEFRNSKNTGRFLDISSPHSIISMYSPNAHVHALSSVGSSQTLAHGGLDGC